MPFDSRLNYQKFLFYCFLFAHFFSWRSIASGESKLLRLIFVMVQNLRHTSGITAGRETVINVQLNLSQGVAAKRPIGQGKEDIKLRLAINHDPIEVKVEIRSRNHLAATMNRNTSVASKTAAHTLILPCLRAEVNTYFLHELA
jgi:hypothetical protein